MSRTGRTAVALAVVVLAAAMAFGVAAYLDERDAPAPRVTPSVTAIDAHAKEIRTVPDVSRDARGSAARAIAAALERIYTAAFAASPDGHVTGATASPSPGPARRVRELFTRDAVAALKRDPAVFDIGPLVVTSGTVNFSGIVTFVDKRPEGVVIDVDFRGRATPRDTAEPVVRVHQRGTLGLVHTSNGWLVRSFDLRLATRPEPTPEPQV